jgi:hypothetical protein
MHTHTAQEGRRRRLAGLLVALGATLALALAAGCGDDDESAVAADRAYDAPHATQHAAQDAAPRLHSEAAHAFQDQMRKLWEDHVTWTRLAIVSYIDDLDDLDATVARLMQNQTDIGDAIEPYYGKRAGDRLTGLLKDHINAAVDLMTAAKKGDTKQLAKADRAWNRNGNQIADFLSAANPDNWPKADMRAMMKSHLDQTLEEAVHRLKGEHEAEVRSYDEIHDHILEMADALSDGIAAQFPQRFE